MKLWTRLSSQRQELSSTSLQNARDLNMRFTHFRSSLSRRQSRKDEHFATCEESIHFRTPTCCTPGCDLKTTWHLSSIPHFCCRKCKNGEGHGHFCHFHAKTGTFAAGTSSSSTSSTSAMKKEARKLREAEAVQNTSSSSSSSQKK